MYDVFALEIAINSIGYNVSFRETKPLRGLNIGID